MFKKTSLIISFLFSIFFFVGLVSGKLLIAQDVVSDPEITSKNIYLGEKDLDTILVSSASSYDLSQMNLASSCETQSKFLGKKQGRYFFAIRFLDDYCDDETVILENEK